MFGRLFLFLRGEPVGQMATEPPGRREKDGPQKTTAEGKGPNDGRNLSDRRNPDDGRNLHDKRNPSSGRGPKRLQNPPAGYCGIKI